MNPDLITFAILFGGGLTTGLAVGFVIAAKATANLLIRKERETWSAAARYHERKSRELA